MYTAGVCTTLIHSLILSYLYTTSAYQLDGNSVNHKQKSSLPSVTRNYDGQGSIIVSANNGRLGDALSILRTHPADPSFTSRRAINFGLTPWRSRIPYIFDKNYGDRFYRNMINRAVRFFNNNTCLTLSDETDNWLKTDPNWFFKKGYADNSYMDIESGSSCSTQVGSPKNNSDLYVMPCHDTDTAIHEFAHGLGFSHVQQTCSARNFLSLFPASIISNLFYTYDHSNCAVRSEIDDVKSTLMYPPYGFADLDGTTYVLLRPDQSQTDGTASSEMALLKELNDRYQCANESCPNVHIDCTPGYLTVVNGKCGCICPPEFDPSTNCKKMISQVDPTRKWDIPITVFGAGSTCPTGFESGYLKFCGTSPSTEETNPSPMTKSGNTINIPLCSKRSPTTNIDWNSLTRGGHYCFVKPAGVDCGGVLTVAAISLQSQCKPELHGAVGDISVQGNNVNIQLCCTANDNYDREAYFPNDAPFRLLNVVTCPYGLGMRTYSHSTTLYTPSAIVTGNSTTPYFYQYKTQDKVDLNFCYLDPPKLGCNIYKELTLNDMTITITSPGYPTTSQTSTRCIYCFTSIADSQMLVTVNGYHNDYNDKFRCKRFNRWGEYNIVKFNNLPYQFVTEGNYLCCDYWTSYETSGTDNRGVSFSVAMLPASESCYDASTKGRNYLGTTNITELSQPCLNWEDTLECFETPYNAQDALNGFFEKNYCRNPNNFYHQPMCYTYKNGTNCVAQYCDPCNTKKLADYQPTSTCTAAIEEDPLFCHTNAGRFGCLKSCHFSQPAAGIPAATCGSPPIPSDAVLVGTKPSTYKVGDRAVVRCAHDSTQESISMLCTQDGWNAPTSTCTASTTVKDLFSSCQTVLQSNPVFCTSSLTSKDASLYCAKTCGADKSSPTCSAPTSTHYKRVDGSGPVHPGQTMTFQCNSGYALVSGDLTRACGLDGLLLGNSPVCRNSGFSIEVGAYLVRERQDTLPAKMALNLDADGLRVPIAGKITSWKYFCSRSGSVNFLVYRRANDNSFDLIGMNDHICIAGFIWTFQVPEDDQISVQEDDTVGVWSSAAHTITVSQCNDYATKGLLLKHANPDNQNELKFTTDFTQTCMVPSFSYTVGN